MPQRRGDGVCGAGVPPEGLLCRSVKEKTAGETPAPQNSAAVSDCCVASTAVGGEDCLGLIKSRGRDGGIPAAHLA
jgi:hypothetical protein